MNKIPNTEILGVMLFTVLVACSRTDNLSKNKNDEDYDLTTCFNALVYLREQVSALAGIAMQV